MRESGKAGGGKDKSTNVLVRKQGDMDNSVEVSAVSRSDALEGDNGMVHYCVLIIQIQ